VKHIFDPIDIPIKIARKQLGISDRLFRKYSQLLRQIIPNSFDFNQYDKSISLKSLYYLEKIREWNKIATFDKIKIKLLEGREEELNESYRRSQKGDCENVKE
jgi:hypothetical protein